MTDYNALFSQAGFATTIKRFCSQLGWNIAEINDKKAVLKFTMSSRRTQTLWILRYDTTLEFSVPSELIFNSENDIPHQLSTLVLKTNSERKIGFWAIETINGKYVYSIMHNAEITLIDKDYFERVVVVLITECDKFEIAMRKMLGLG